MITYPVWEFNDIPVDRATGRHQQAVFVGSGGGGEELSNDLGPRRRFADLLPGQGRAHSRMPAVIVVPPWVAIPVGLALLVVAVLLAIWWRQQTFRWALVVVLCLLLAPLLSWWSGRVFRVEPYRAGCDALCVGRAGAPIATARIDGDIEDLPAAWISRVNTLLYLALTLAWMAVVRSVVVRVGRSDA